MDDLERNVEGTVLFLPERLNRNPVVLRGMTSDEMLLAGAVGVLLGIPLGLLLWLFIGQMPLLPTGMGLGLFMTLFFGGTLLRRLKRGKPQTWVYRLLHFELLRRFGLAFGQMLIIRSGYWTCRRSERYEQKRLALMACHEQEALA